jgi:hypothetical protein
MNNPFNNKVIGLILDRELMNQDFKKLKDVEIDEDIFNEYCDLLKRYQALNHELFTFELVQYLKQFKSGDEVFQFDNYIILKSRSAYFDQGLRIVEAII